MLANIDISKAKKHSEKIKKYPALKGEKQPTFSQFLQYITGEDQGWQKFK